MGRVYNRYSDSIRYKLPNQFVHTMVMSKDGNYCVEHQHNIICCVHTSRDRSQSNSEKLF